MERLIKYLNDLLHHVEYWNDMAPFPVYDTEYVEEIRKSIKHMEKEQYDDLPVAACRFCHSLHIVTDEEENEHCMRCGSKNEVVVYSNIKEYFDKTQIDEAV